VLARNTATKRRTALAVIGGSSVARPLLRSIVPETRSPAGALVVSAGQWPIGKGTGIAVPAVDTAMLTRVPSP